MMDKGDRARRWPIITIKCSKETKRNHCECRRRTMAAKDELSKERLKEEETSESRVSEGIRKLHKVSLNGKCV